MHRTYFTTQRQPSIAVIQGAYEWLCAEGEQVGTEIVLGTGIRYSSETDFTLHLSVLPALYTGLPTEPPVEEWLKFQALVDAWRAERGAMSSITEMSMCPAYQTIIGMGEAVIPFILAQLESEGDDPDQWFWALRAITGANPVLEEHQGDYLQMARSWLAWGEKSGYVG